MACWRGTTISQAPACNTAAALLAAGVDAHDPALRTCPTARRRHAAMAAIDPRARPRRAPRAASRARRARRALPAAVSRPTAA